MSGVFAKIGATYFIDAVAVLPCLRASAKTQVIHPAKCFVRRLEAPGFPGQRGQSFLCCTHGFFMLCQDPELPGHQSHI